MIKDVAEILRAHLLVGNFFYQGCPGVFRIDGVAEFFRERLMPFIDALLLHIAGKSVVDGLAIIDNQQSGLLEESFLLGRKVAVEDEPEDIVSELACIHLAAQGVRHRPQLGGEFLCLALICLCNCRFSRRFCCVCHGGLPDDRCGCY